MLPHADCAVIDPAKVRDYLLSPTHPVGRFKATVFFALGYTHDDWQRLADDLLALAHSGEAQQGRPSRFGRKYEVSGILKGPSGRAASFTTVWLLRQGSKQPTFVTAFPG